jgi:hypothetical protein
MIGTSIVTTSKGGGAAGPVQATSAAAASKDNNFLDFIAALCIIRLYTATPARLCNRWPHALHLETQGNIG